MIQMILENKITTFENISRKFFSIKFDFISPKQDYFFLNPKNENIFDVSITYCWGPGKN